MKIDILPKDIIDEVKAEGKNLDFSMIRLEIFLRDGWPRYDITIAPADDRHDVTIAQKEFDILPDEVVDRVKAAGTGIKFGMIQLDIFLKDGKLSYEIHKKKSVIPADNRPGVTVAEVKI